ncbi:SRPBCC family protein [Cellulomonas marina]|uniref:Polyketide cyclase / dehydrase and lipid transport n=1 Tax=Cellulomonas marina TaxID=988821 RepID=A0A1I0Z4K8_9CELL|nr:SRPBCC family protein [Cellulomonas marina]GIG28229.1 polyketide cyclase [Cellulomonas marina]SFB20277.1 Polyketide cyclase / dehydrase and lipid transport [Cellulomonas marina]
METVSRVVHAPASAVLAVLADGWSYASWVVGASRIEGVDPSWPEQGSRIAHSVGPWPAVIDDITVSRGWDPEHGIRLRARGWPLGEALIVVHVEPLGDDRCRVEFAEDASSGPGRLVPPPLRHLVLRWRNIETVKRLALLAERPSPEVGRHPHPER